MVFLISFVLFWWPFRTLFFQNLMVFRIFFVFLWSFGSLLFCSDGLPKLSFSEFDILRVSFILFRWSSGTLFFKFDGLPDLICFVSVVFHNSLFLNPMVFWIYFLLFRWSSGASPFSESNGLSDLICFVPMVF